MCAMCLVERDLYDLCDVRTYVVGVIKHDLYDVCNKILQVACPWGNDTTYVYVCITCSVGVHCGYDRSD